MRTGGEEKEEAFEGGKTVSLELETDRPADARVMRRPSKRGKIGGSKRSKECCCVRRLRDCIARQGSELSVLRCWGSLIPCAPRFAGISFEVVHHISRWSVSYYGLLHLGAAFAAELVACVLGQ